MANTLENQTQYIVDKQLDAYNNRDIEAFAATYHQDVEIHHFPGGMQYQGIEEIRKRYGKKFAELKCLRASSKKRIVLGRFLTDYELAESCSQAEGQIDRSIEVMVTYEVVDGLIKRVVFMQE